MARYHQTVDKNGTPVMKPCHATVKVCPVGGDAVHHDFANAQSAYMWNDAAQQVQHGIYMGELQDRAASGEDISESAYEQAMDEAFAYKEDHDKRGAYALLDPNNKSFLVRNAPLEDLVELVDESDELTYDDYLAISNRLQGMPDGDAKDRLQATFVYSCSGAASRRYLNADDFVYEMVQTTGDDRPEYQNELRRNFYENKRNVDALLENARKSQSPEVQEAFKDYERYAAIDAETANARHKEIQKDKASRERIMNVEWTEKDGTRHSGPAPAPKPGQEPRANPVPPPPPSSSRGSASHHKTTNRYSKKSQGRSQSVLNPMGSGSPFEAGSQYNRTTPPPPPRRSMNDPAWRSIGEQGASIADDYASLSKSVAAEAADSKKWMEDFTTMLSDKNDMVDRRQRAVESLSKTKDRLRTNIYGSAERPTTMRGRMKAAGKLFGSVVRHPRRTMQDFQTLRDVDHNLGIARSNLATVTMDRDQFREVNGERYRDIHYRMASLDKIKESLQDNRKRLDETMNAMRSGASVPIYVGMPGGGTTVTSSNNPTDVMSYLHGLQETFRATYYSYVHDRRHW